MDQARSAGQVELVARRRPYAQRLRRRELPGRVGAYRRTGSDRLQAGIARRQSTRDGRAGEGCRCRRLEQAVGAEVRAWGVATSELRNLRRAQIEGGVLFGLSAALFNGITFDKGRVQQGNFNDYRQLRINETPPIEVHLLYSGEKPGGLGEVGTVSAAPALGNAIFAATGVRIRRLPIDRRLLSKRGSS
jgi:hypothetical protein